MRYLEQSGVLQFYFTRPCRVWYMAGRSERDPDSSELRASLRKRGRCGSNDRKGVRFGRNITE